MISFLNREHLKNTYLVVNYICRGVLRLGAQLLTYLNPGLIVFHTFRQAIAEKLVLTSQCSHADTLFHCTAIPKSDISETNILSFIIKKRVMLYPYPYSYSTSLYISASPEIPKRVFRSENTN